MTHKFRRAFLDTDPSGGGGGGGGLPGRRTRIRRPKTTLEAEAEGSSSAGKAEDEDEDKSVLIGVDGSLGASVLLDLMKRSYFVSEADSGMGGEVKAKTKAMNGRPRHGLRRPWRRAYVCYVEVCGAFAEVSALPRSLSVITHRLLLLYFATCFRFVSFSLY